MSSEIIVMDILLGHCYSDWSYGGVILVKLEAKRKHHLGLLLQKVHAKLCVLYTFLLVKV